MTTPGAQPGGSGFDTSPGDDDRDCALMESLAAKDEEATVLMRRLAERDENDAALIGGLGEADGPEAVLAQPSPDPQP